MPLFQLLSDRPNVLGKFNLPSSRTVISSSTPKPSSRAERTKIKRVRDKIINEFAVNPKLADAKNKRTHTPSPKIILPKDEPQNKNIFKIIRTIDAKRIAQRSKNILKSFREKLSKSKKNTREIRKIISR